MQLSGFEGGHGWKVVKFRRWPLLLEFMILQWLCGSEVGNSGDCAMGHFLNFGLPIKQGV